MNEKKKRIIVGACVIAGCILIGMLIYDTVRINQKYPQTKVQEIALGKEADMEKGISLTVKETQWLTNEEFIEKYGENIDVNNETDARVILVDVLVKNNTNAEKNVEYINLYLEKQGYCNGLALDTFMELSDAEKVGEPLKSKEEYQAKLAFVIYGYQFKKADWKKVEKEKFYLVNKRYPVKTCWNIQE